MSSYYGLQVSKKEFLSLIDDQSVIYKLTTDKNKTIGFMSAGHLVYTGSGILNRRIKIVESEITQLEQFDSYYVAK